MEENLQKDNFFNITSVWNITYKIDVNVTPRFSSFFFLLSSFWVVPLFSFSFFSHIPFPRVFLEIERLLLYSSHNILFYFCRYFFFRYTALFLSYSTLCIQTTITSCNHICLRGYLLTFFKFSRLLDVKLNYPRIIYAQVLRAKIFNAYSRTYNLKLLNFTC